MAVMQPEINAIQKKYKDKKDNDSVMKMNAETRAVYDKYGTSMMAGCLQLFIQMPILLALYRVVYNIPAYVYQVKEIFLNVVYDITGITSVAQLSEGAAGSLIKFASENGFTDKEISAFGDLVGVSGEPLANKMVDILYKFNPSQWGQLANYFPTSASSIMTNAARIDQMNSFLSINLSVSPWQGNFIPNLAWIIPVLAGLSQWLSTKLMTSSQNNNKNEEAPGSQMMKQMNVTMPLMSVFFCFTFPGAVGLYWVASSVFQIIQQVIINYYMDRVDMDEMIAKNIEKSNKKREKRGLPPAKVNTNISASLKQLEMNSKKEDALKAEKEEKVKEQIKKSSDYYNKNAKPGSLASKANMVAQYNEKHNKK